MAVELANYPTLRNDSALVAYYRFEGNANDETANANNGTSTNITYSTGNGKFGQGAGFNGSSSDITIPDSSSFSFTNTCTINFWYNPISITSNPRQNVLNKWIGGSNYGWNFYHVPSSGQLDWTETSDGTVGTILDVQSTGTTIIAGQWQLVSFTKNGTSGKFYINGSSVTDNGTALHTNMYHSTDSLQIGDDNGATWMTYPIDDLSIFNRVLSATEISNYYNAVPSSGNSNFLSFFG